MKLNTTHVRYLSPDDWYSLISQLSSLHGSISRSISTLTKAGLIAKIKNTTYDCYWLIYRGLDFLSLYSLIKKNIVFSISQTPLGVDELGRISFRSIKRSRDYLDNNRTFKSSEASFMMAFYNHNFPVPKLIPQNRHTLLMTLHRAPPLRNLQNCPDIPGLWVRLMELLVRLGQHRLVHDDFNEFNLLCYEGTTEVVVIDFPQMERDLEGLKRWFQRRWRWVVDEKTLPRWEKDVLKGKKVGKGERVAEEVEGSARLNALVDATGFSKKQLKELEKAIRDQRGEDGEGANAGDEDEDEEEGEEEEEEEEGDAAVAHGCIPLCPYPS
ncbi:atypical/RIO/RIO2 protein kinase [Tirmania nivea]|nr:atypical/RIO/RIO2 protein kinase [Tirmania nivea]